MMELDASDLDRYLASPHAFAMPHTMAVRNAGPRGMNGTSPVDRSGPGIRRASTPGMVGAVGMDEIVAENARELRRRSLASGYGMDFMNVGGNDHSGSFSGMVSPSYSTAELSQMGSDMRLPTTMEYSEMDSSAPELSAVGMMGVGNISCSEMQSSISMFADPQGLSGTSHSSPVTSSLSVPPSPVGPQMPGSPLGPHAHRMSVDSLTSSPMNQMHMSQMSGATMDQVLVDSMGGGSFKYLSVAYYEGSMGSDLRSSAGMSPSSAYAPLGLKSHLFTGDTYSSSGFDMLGVLVSTPNVFFFNCLQPIMDTDSNKSCISTG